MIPIRGLCQVCEDPDSWLYAVSDITKPPPREKVGELCLCDSCRDLIGTGWARLQIVEGVRHE